MTRPVRAALAAALVVLVLGVAGGCGVRPDSKPRAISKEQIPSDAETGAASTAGAETQPARLYFTYFDGQSTELVPVEQPVPVGSASQTPVAATVLETLFEGPPDTKASGGTTLRTAIPPKTALRRQPRLDADGVLTVDLNDAILGVRADGARLAFGQTVCTSDALAGVDSVQIEVQGKPFPVPMGNGEASSEPVSCPSYRNLVGRPPR